MPQTAHGPFRLRVGLNCFITSTRTIPPSLPTVQCYIIMSTARRKRERGAATLYPGSESERKAPDRAGTHQVLERVRHHTAAKREKREESEKTAVARE